jgi:hypothetical protein
MMYGDNDIKKSRKGGIRQKFLKKHLKEVQSKREYNNISDLINRVKQEERDRIVKLLDKQVYHSRLECGISCTAHKQIQFIKNLKD